MNKAPRGAFSLLASIAQRAAALELFANGSNLELVMMASVAHMGGCFPCVDWFLAERPQNLSDELPRLNAGGAAYAGLWQSTRRVWTADGANVPY